MASVLFGTGVYAHGVGRTEGTMVRKQPFISTRSRSGLLRDLKKGLHDDASMQ